MADKLNMKSRNIPQENVKKIQSLFPNAVTEVLKDGKPMLAVNFDVLKQEMSDVLIDDKQERYQFTWPDKKKSILLANSPISATLRPCKEESVDFDNTKNLYIEGDNLDILKLLQETYLGKIKMIYIDPPYNTGNDFVYSDDFLMDSGDYANISGQYDEQGNRLFKNLDSNGRFHTDWLNMIYPRLKVAKDLLADDGVIFISIDDNEVENLKKICGEIFGEKCLSGILIQNKGNAQNDAHNIQKNHEYILCYFKNVKCILENVLSLKETVEKEVFKDDKGYFYKGAGIVTGGEGGTLNKRPNLGHSIYYNELTNDIIAVQDYDISKAKILNNESEVYVDDESLINRGYSIIRPPKKGTKLGVWTWSLEKINAEKKDLLINKTKDGYSICKKVYIDEKVYLKNNKNFVVVKKEMPTRSILDFSTSKGSTVVNNLLGMKVFDNPKNVDLMLYLINLINDKEMTIIDFFSGSATTAHAVMQLNAIDGGTRKYIMIQLPEKVENSEFETICEIGKERIRRAGKKIKEETGEDVDYGFRVLKLDSSNMQDVYYNPGNMTQSLLDITVDNIKPDRTPLDLLFQVMLDLGIELSTKIEEKQVNEKTYFVVNDNDIIACFDDNIDNAIITEIAKQQPLYAVFKDKSFASDSVGINNEQLFKTYSPATAIKVI